MRLIRLHGVPGALKLAQKNARIKSGMKGEAWWMVATFIKHYAKATHKNPDDQRWKEIESFVHLSDALVYAANVRRAVRIGSKDGRVKVANRGSDGRVHVYIDRSLIARKKR